MLSFDSSLDNYSFARGSLNMHLIYYYSGAIFGTNSKHDKNYSQLDILISRKI